MFYFFFYWTPERWKAFNFLHSDKYKNHIIYFQLADAVISSLQKTKQVWEIINLNTNLANTNIGGGDQATRISPQGRQKN